MYNSKEISKLFKKKLSFQIITRRPSIKKILKCIFRQKINNPRWMLRDAERNKSQ